MSNHQVKPSDPYKNMRDLPLNIQMAICLVSSVLRRMAAKQEQPDGTENTKATSQE